MNRRRVSIHHSSWLRQTGLTLVEMLVSITISLVVLSGVVQVLVVTKSNFISVREMASMQENARYAFKYLTDEIRMAGYSGCASPLKTANSVNSTNWYLDVGLKGYEYDAGINNYPVEFRSDVRPYTDALAVRRGDVNGLRVSNHNPNSAQIDVNSVAHSYKPGSILMIANPDCEQVGIFQMTGPNNTNNNATNFVHNTGASVSPGNCTKNLRGNFTCANTGASENTAYANGATIMELHSEAYYVGNSERNSAVPALFRERMLLNTSTSTPYTTAEELVEGVENMQILYGLDNSNGDGIADIYLKANSVTNWNNVVTVRLTVRMRSTYPVYNKAIAYDAFEGVTGTSGSDAYMRQTISSTIAIRN